jgi:hypothetical protein
MRSFWVVTAVTVALVYIGICWFLYANQRSMIYYGGFTRIDPSATDFALARPDATLRGWVVNPGKPDPILYFGGNGESIQLNREDFARWFPGRSVYLLAYRGYGASDGEPSEAAIVQDALVLFDHVHHRPQPGQRRGQPSRRAAAGGTAGLDHAVRQFGGRGADALPGDPGRLADARALRIGQSLARVP